MVFNPFDIHLKTKKPTYEVADVLREFGEAYEQKYGLTQEQAQEVKHLTECRTAALGVLVDECNECGALTFSYPSCGDRTCRPATVSYPKPNAPITAREWITHRGPTTVFS